MSATVTIDDISEPGAWADAIAHTPGLQPQTFSDPVDALRVDPPSEVHNVND